MAFFELSSDITIGEFRFTGVHEVQIKRSMHSIVETAVIKIPSVARIKKEGTAMGEDVIAGKLFKEGQQVIIKLGYNGELKTEFQGFVKECSLAMPTEISCEGYSWALRRTAIGGFMRSITVKELLNRAVGDLVGARKIAIKCDVDTELHNVHIANMSGFDLVQHLSTITDGGLTSFFIEPNVLWCGITYTAYANGKDAIDLGEVHCRLGYNVIKKNTLKDKSVDDDKMQMTYSKKLPDGKIIRTASDVFSDFARAETKILNQVADTASLKAFADEKAYKQSYGGYEGGITAFLQPYATPGYRIAITDSRYNDREGLYIVESTELTFGIKGARRVIEVGPKLGFAKDKQ